MVRCGEREILKATVVMTVLMGLTACGGSGGSSGSAVVGDTGGATGGTTGVSNGDSGIDTGGSPVEAPAIDCPAALSLVDTSTPDTMIGDGTVASCTTAALKTALIDGGVIAFDCGADPVTLSVGEELTITQDTVIDGGGRVTLDGGQGSRILSLRSSFEKTTPSLTVQRLTFRNGASSDTGEDTTSGGAAIYRIGGSLNVIDSQFINNRAPVSGQDIAGGAIYSLGGGETVISGSGFSENRASNGGAIGNLHNDLVVINSTFSSNVASGTGGNPGNGGNGGAIYIDGVSQSVNMCGVRILGNTGNAHGGGVFRVSNDLVGSHLIDRSTIDGNRVTDTSVSSAGGLYLQGVEISISNSTVSRNTANYGGGMFVGPGSTLNMLNSTVAENEAVDSLGGGMVISDGVTGLIKNVTLANNRASDSDSFAAATVGGAGVTMQNTLVDGHSAGNGYNPISCRAAFLEGSGNQQFPVDRSGAGSDDPSALCTSDTLVADALLGALGNHGGDTETLLPTAGSPVIGLASDCPATDQRGVARSEPCTAGAVEVSQ